jgi:gliding motility-associated-like protein
LKIDFFMTDCSRNTPPPGFRFIVVFAVIVLVCSVANGQSVKPVSINQIPYRPIYKIGSNAFSKNIPAPKKSNIVYSFPNTPVAACNEPNTFQMTYVQGPNDHMYDFAPTPDGGFIMAGESNRPAVINAAILKTDARGNFLWNRRIWNNTDDAFYRIRNTSDGGFIATGYIDWTSSQAIYLVKITASGAVSWSAIFGAAGPYSSLGNDVIETADGGFAVAASYGANYDTANIVVIKTSNNGTLQWSKKFYSSAAARATGLAAEGNNLYISGLVQDSFYSAGDGVIIKLDAISGQTYWTKRYDKGGMDDQALSVDYSSNGLVVAFSHNDNVHYILEKSFARLDLDGNVLLAKKLNSPQANNISRFIAPCSDGGYIAALGYTTDYTPNAEIARFDASGNTIFSKKLTRPGYQLMKSVMQLNDGTFAMAGDYSPYAGLLAQAELIKTDSNGNTGDCTTDSITVTTSDEHLVAIPYNWVSVKDNVYANTQFLTPLADSDIVSQNQLCRSLPCDSAALSPCLETFEKLYGGKGDEIAYDTHQTSDNGYIVTGKTTSGASGTTDGFIMKLSKAGAIKWSKIVGGNDQDILSKVKETTTGFIAIGTTASFGDTKGETWLVNMTAGGTVQWARHYSTGGVNGEKGKDVIQLPDGGYAFVSNVNDSSALGDGVVVRTDALGNVIWSKRFDNGNDDGFNTLMQDGNMIIVGGYTSYTNRDAVLMKLNISDGSVISATSYFNFDYEDDEMINIEKINNGIAYSFRSSNTPGNWYNIFLSHFKERDDGTLFYQRRSQVEQFNRVRGLAAITSADSGYLYVSCDTTLTAFGELNKVGPTGINEWRRSSYDQGYYLMALDRIGSSGVVSAGYVNSYNTSNTNKILMLATENTGMAGECSPGLGQDFVDTAHYTITPFTWSKISGDIISVSSAIYPVVADAGFAGNTICAQTVCDSLPPIADSCTSGTAIKYNSDYVSLLTDITKAADSSYFMCGQYYYYSTVEPLIVKAKPNGDVAWAKTYNQFIHLTSLLKIVNTTDGGVLVAGTNSYTINHQVTDSAMLIKIDKNGAVAWAKNYNNEFGANINDIIPSGDGGFFMSLTEGWGGGSTNTTVAKINGNGDFVWKKDVVASASAPVFRNLTLDGKSLFVVSDDYSVNGILMIVKMDAATGNYTLSKNYVVNSGQLVVRSVQAIADTLFVFYIDHQQLLYSAPNNLAMLKVNAQTGAYLGGLLFNNPSFSYEYVYSSVYNYHMADELVKTSDNNFVFSNQVTNGDTASLNMLCFNSSGAVQWQRDYPNLNNTGVFALQQAQNELLLVTQNKRFNPDNNIFPYTGGLIKTDLSGNIKVAAAPSAACYGTLINNATTQKLDFSEIPSRIAGIEDATDFNSADFSPYVRVINFGAQQECTEVSNCKQLDITGTDSVCNISDTITYNIIKSRGCTAAALWQIDTAMVKITATTDTSLKVIFRKAGITNINASMNSGCTVISKSFPVTVMAGPGTLDLGPDKVICGHDSVVLNAHRGFKSYLWQDGSTDSTFKVTTPGTYYVKVVSLCSGALSDTVNISSGMLLPLVIGEDTSICKGDSISLYASGGFASYVWSPVYNINKVSGPAVSAWPASDTTYTVIATQPNGCTVKDSIHIGLYAIQPISLGNDTSICEGNHLQLDAGAGFAIYKWNTGATSERISVSAAGFYNVTATDIRGCRSKDTLQIKSVFIPTPIHLGGDTSLCSGEILHLNAGNGFNNYSWSTGALTASIDVNDAGTFWVDAIDSNHCHSGDTINILSILPIMPIHLGNDTSICQGEKMPLDAGPGFAHYQWNTGETTQEIYASQQGLYFIAARNNNNCISRDSLLIVQVNALPVVNLDKDPDLCVKATKILDAGPGTRYLWQDGSVNRTFTATGPGKYWVTVTNNNNCSTSDTTAITTLQPLPGDFLISDTTVCDAEPLILYPNKQLYSGYLWSTGAMTSSIQITLPGQYWLQVTDVNGCTAKEYVNISPKDCINAIYFPNAFTPNNDGVNDTYEPKVYGILLKFHLVIYNRFGQKIFETYDHSKAWDGTLKNATQDSEVFSWYSEYQFKNEPSKTRKGVVTLIR